MLPILLGVGVAALFLSGCTDTKKTQESDGVKPNGGGGPSASSSVQVDAAAPPTRAPSYYVSFGNNLRAADFYQRLSAKGVSDETLDRGCKLPFNRFVPWPTLAKDRRIEACEVYDFALDNYRQHPDVVATLTGSPIPWTLDGSLLQERVHEIVAKLDATPAFKKIEKGSEEYRRALGSALAFYVDFPNEYRTLEYQRDFLVKQSQVLVDMGLKEFQEDLLRNGGLAGLKIAEFPGAEWVGNANQAWELGRGGPSARAKLLYAVLAEAGVNPVFIFASAKTNSDWFEPSSRDFPYLLNFGGRRSQFLQVGISLAATNPATGRPQLARFEGLRPESDPEANIAAQELSLAAYLAMDFHGRADFDMLRSQGDPGIPYKLAVNISPADTAIFNSIGAILERLGSLEQAMVSYKEALRYDPTNGIASYNLGQLYERQENHEAAVNAFLGVAVWSPELFAKRTEIVEAAAQKVLAKDPAHREAAALVSKIKDIRSGESAEKPDAH